MLKQMKLVYYHVTLIVEVAERVTTNKPVKEHNWPIMTEFENSADTLNTIVLRGSFYLWINKPINFFNVLQKLFFKI